jgi:hypothetical protein
MAIPPQPQKPILDARTFQTPLRDLATTVAYKVDREGREHIPVPAYVTGDIFILMRQTMYTYDLLFFINADERRQKDPDYRVAYSPVSLPLIRCMIDCLYNVTVILTNPGLKGYEFRASGYRTMLASFDEDGRRYGGDPKWDEWIARMRAFTLTQLKGDGFTEAEVRTAKPWKTLGAYLRVKKGAPLTEHQEFLKKLTYGFWREYSGMAHGAFEGLLPTAAFYITKEIPHDLRPTVDTMLDNTISLHLPRMSAILLSMITEIQAYFRFDGARINERIYQIWDALMHAPEVKELYDERYKPLMEERGITRTISM